MKHRTNKTEDNQRSTGKIQKIGVPDDQIFFYEQFCAN